jgi:hypothetical protein
MKRNFNGFFSNAKAKLICFSIMCSCGKTEKVIVSIRGATETEEHWGKCNSGTYLKWRKKKFLDFHTLHDGNKKKSENFCSPYTNHTCTSAE